MTNLTLTQATTPSLSVEQQFSRALDLLDLEGWTPGQEVPKTATMERLNAAQSAATVALRPIGKQALAVLLDRLFSFAEAFNLKANPKALTPIYAQAFQSYPEDLAEKAVNGTLQNWKGWGRLPTPAEMLESVSPELTRRRLMESKIRLAIQRKPPERPERTPIDPKALDALMAKHRKRFPTSRPSSTAEHAHEASYIHSD